MSAREDSLFWIELLFVPFDPEWPRYGK